MSSSDLDIIRDYFDRVYSDPGASESFYAADCVLHYSGSHILSGDYVGLEAILQMFRESAKRYVMPLTLQLRDLAASDKVVVAVLTARAGAEDTKMTTWLRLVMFRLENGRIAEQWLLDYDQAAVGGLLV